MSGLRGGEIRLDPQSIARRQVRDLGNRQCLLPACNRYSKARPCKIEGCRLGMRRNSGQQRDESEKNRLTDPGGQWLRDR